MIYQARMRGYRNIKLAAAAYGAAEQAMPRLCRRTMPGSALCRVAISINISNSASIEMHAPPETALKRHSESSPRIVPLRRRTLHGEM